MTKQRAIKILKELIDYKKRCVEVMDADSFTTDLEDIRIGMVKLAQSDQETLEMILKELERKNVRKGKEKSL